MNGFLESLPRRSGELNHVIDLHEWEDPEAPAKPLSFEELRQWSTDSYDAALNLSDEENVKQIIQMIVEAARVGRMLDDYKERVQLDNQIRFWEAHLRFNGIDIDAPSIWEHTE